jgi:hypothetical protein
MKMQKLFVVILTTLLTAGVSLSQPPTPASPGAETAGSKVVTTVIRLKYYPANELSSLLQELFQREPTVAVFPDQHVNQIILNAPEKRVEEILQVVKALDVDNVQAPQAQYLTCRVYMLELPSKDRNLKPFSVLLEGPSELPAGQVLAAARDPNVQITTLLQRTEGDRCELVIEGRAVSNKALQQVLAKRPDSHIKQLKWDEEDFTAALPAAQVSRLPAPLQEHIRKFLGDEVRTVGYWFGNLSIPGDLDAPIGPWRLDLKTRSGQGSDLVLEVRVTRESPLPFVNETQLFSNTVQSKAGRPIIIGYNRESYGTRVMGAMVILLEPDTTAPAGPATSRPSP